MIENISTDSGGRNEGNINTKIDGNNCDKSSIDSLPMTPPRTLTYQMVSDVADQCTEFRELHGVQELPLKKPKLRF